MKRYKNAAFSWLFGAATILTSPVLAGEPVVVELFTSQGCSACPPADALMADLAEEEDVIALSWSVSIWDYIGWEDTLAIPLSNARHSWYNRLNGSNMVYTPQIFIDGQEAYVGSHKKKIQTAITSHRGDASTMVDIGFDESAKDWVTLDFSAPLPKNAQVKIIFFDEKKTVKIGAGENNGRKLTYTNIVRGAQTLALQNGASLYRVDLSSAFAKNCDAFAVLVQDRVTGKMLGANIRRAKDTSA